MSAMRTITAVAAVNVSGVTGGNIAGCLKQGIPHQILVPLLPIDQSFGDRGHGKAPARYDSISGTWVGIPDWHRGGHSADLLCMCDQAGGNAGVILGSPYDGLQLLAVDIDLLDTPNAVGWCKAIVRAFQRRWGQTVLVRETWPHRALLLVNLPVDANPGVKKKFTISYADPAASGEEPTVIGAIELLARGQQAAVAGTHISGNPMRWYFLTENGEEPERYLAPPLKMPPLWRDAPPQLTLPALASGDAVAVSIVNLLTDMAPYGFSYSMLAMSASTGMAPALADLAAPSADDIANLLGQTPNPASVDRDIYTNVMHAIAGAQAGLAAMRGALAFEDKAKIANAAAEWSSRWNAPQGSTASTFAEELDKWTSDWGIEKDTHFAGWRHLLIHCQAFGAPRAAIANLAAERARDSFKADGPMLLKPGETMEQALDRLHPSATDVPPTWDAVDLLIKEFNARYMVVREGGKVLIFIPVFDKLMKRDRYDRMSFEDFRKLHSNRRVDVPQKGGKGYESAPVADVWLTHGRRHQYPNGVVFDPSTTVSADGMLNLWKGFAVTPRPGCWDKLKFHILDVLCRGNRDHARYLIGWMARLVQQPASPGEVAVVLRGGEGTGKGILARALKHLFGQHGISVTNAKHLTGNFNGHLRDAVLVFGDEAFYAGDKAHVGVLKVVITEPTITVEAKYRDAVEMQNFVHLIMASNEKWVVPASIDSRRFYVLDVPDTRANDHDYFGAIQAELAAGGYEAMLHDLLQVDISKFNVRSVPVTEGLIEQRKLSLKVPENWWQDVLHRGFVYQSRIGADWYFGRWMPVISTETLYASYEAYARSHRERDLLSREAFGGFLGRMGATPTRRRGLAVGECVATGYSSIDDTAEADDDASEADGDEAHAEDPPGNGALANLMDLGNTPVPAVPMEIRERHGGEPIIRRGLAYGYGVGPLDDARKAFEAAVKMHIEWPRLPADADPVAEK